MKTQTWNPQPYGEMVRVLESIAEKRQAQGAPRPDQLYYHLLARHHRRVLEAEARGQKRVAHAIMFPVEIFYAMDLVPYDLETGSSTFMVLLRNYEELFSAAKAYGLNPDICSVHRSVAGAFYRGWIPRPHAIVWSKQGCDNTAHIGQGIAELTGAPGFCVDRPYRHREREVAYYTQELEELVTFLEKATGNRMDWDRLRECLDYSGQMIRLQKEIYQLRKSRPSPAANRRAPMLQAMNWQYMGTPEGVEFCQAVRDELKERVDKGEGPAPQEKYRLASFFPAPIHAWKILDWMQREHGATIVADPFLSHWGDWEPDPRHPLESIARRTFAIPSCRSMHGPVQEAVLQDAARDSLEHQAQGAIYWANIGCPQGCGIMRAVKDAVVKGAGLPFFVINMDYGDPSFVSHEEIKERLEEFFEVLAERTR